MVNTLQLTHFSCKLKWKKLNDKKYKYIVEELTGKTTQSDSNFKHLGSDDLSQIYAGFGDECKMEDLESLKSYKVRLTVEIDGNSTVSRSTDWLTFTTNKEPYNVALLNSAVKRDDGVKVRTILTTESVSRKLSY